MPLNVTIIGIGGRLGSAIAREILRNDRYALTGGVVRADSDHAGRDLGELADTNWIGRTASVRLEDAVDGADVIIDASTPDTSIAMAKRIADMGGPAYITGVTGMTVEQTTMLKAASKIVPILTARNFSIGVTLVEMLVSIAAEGLPKESWDAEIVETHHKHKADAPSGTALVFGEAIANARQDILDMVAERGRSASNSARTPGAIGFASVRGGNVIGEHAIRFITDNEEIAITHRAMDRNVFAQGALAAASWMKDKKPGLYTMRQVVMGEDI